MAARAAQRGRARTYATLDRYLSSSVDAAGDRLMPTLLGNILRGGEDNAGNRYGLDVPIIYPRMYPLLSAKLDKAISAQFDMLDTMRVIQLAA